RELGDPWVETSCFGELRAIDANNVWIVDDRTHGGQGARSRPHPVLAWRAFHLYETFIAVMSNGGANAYEGFAGKAALHAGDGDVDQPCSKPLDPATGDRLDGRFCALIEVPYVVNARAYEPADKALEGGTS